MQRKAVIAGGSGFLGRALTRDLAGRGWDVVILSRQPAAPTERTRTVIWDGKTVGPWAEELDGAAALINLAGRSVACRYTPENRRAIIDSRVDSVRALDAAIAVCRVAPPVWVQATSLAIYGDPGDQVCTEAAPAAHGFTGRVCQAWEAALFEPVRSPPPRRVALRIGFVLGKGGGAFQPLAGLARCFLGGSAGSGRQFISWLHVDDFCAMVRWAIATPSAAGAYNATGPAPVTNRDFMRALRRALHRPWCPPAPAFLVRLVAYTVLAADGSLALGGRRCVPRRLEAEGFQFEHPDLAETIEACL